MLDSTITLMTDRLAQQFAFIREIDRSKPVLRRTSLIDRSRRENSAEHSWHLATMALVLAEYAPAGADTMRVVEMLLVHDIVEIDAGDTFAFDVAANVGKAERETAAAERIFNLLPGDLAGALRARWDEFEADETPTARFANALDRLQGLVLNDAAGDGGTWRLHGVGRPQGPAGMCPAGAGRAGAGPGGVRPGRRPVARGGR